jgi:chitinase
MSVLLFLLLLPLMHLAPFFADAVPLFVNDLTPISLPLPAVSSVLSPPDISLITPHIDSIVSRPPSPSNTVDTPLVMAYYPDWASASLAPEDIDFTRVDWIDYAFALPDQNFALSWDDPVGSPDLLKRLVQTAHAAGKYVKLSVGGWTGSKCATFPTLAHQLLV